MISRALSLVVCLTAVACGPGVDPATGPGGAGGGSAGTTGAAGTGGSAGTTGGSAGTTGAAGTGGSAGTTGGSAGTTGAAGTGGSAGTTGGSAGQGGTGGFPACVTPSARPYLNASDESGSQPRMSLTTAVTVASVEECTPTICSGRQIVLAEAGGRQWRLSAYFPGMPADAVAVGEALELRIEYRPIRSPFGPGGMFEFWSTVLSRGGTAVMFDVSSVADLAAYGITAVPSGRARCVDLCARYSADVTYGMETRNVAPYHTATIGKLTVSHRYFSEMELCFGDVPMPTVSMAGFTAR